MSKVFELCSLIYAVFTNHAQRQHKAKPLKPLLFREGGYSLTSDILGICG